MEQLPNIVRERMKRTAAGDHPDADLLTAFAEQALPERERARVLLHLSNCGDCRDVVALAAPPVTLPASLDTARRTPWFEWKVLRWGAAVACVLIVGSAVLMRHATMSPPATLAVKEDSHAEQLAYQKLEEPAAAVSQAERAAAPAQRIAHAKKAVEAPKAKASQQLLPPVAAPLGDSSTAFQSKQLVIGSLGAGVAHRNVTAGMVLDRADQPAPPAPAVPPANEADKLPASASETVEVEAMAPALQAETVARAEDKREALGKAKAASGGMPAAAAALPATGNQTAYTYETARQKDETVGQKVERENLRRSPLTRWTISSDGQLQHSSDAGQTWQPVSVADKASFRALSANGPDVWVGGAAGSLYHSTDSGASWVQVKPTAAKATLTADIAAIEFTDVRQGKITTSNGEVWITQDAGQTWQKQ